jgi:hAT family C-terminal dimerisation region
MYHLADVRWDVLNDIMSSYYLHIQRIFGLKALQKLSDYYGKSDESQYYTWASCTSCILSWYATLLTSSLVLDPRISYSGLLADCSDDSDARAHLETTKEHLHSHFHTKYNKPLPARTTPVASTSAVNGSPQKVDFTSHYRNLPQAYTDEVQEYFKLPRENFDTCDPLQWWAGHRSQCPNLYHFARDILSIPGEFTTDFWSYSVQISDGYVDNMMTLYRLRRRNGHPPYYI